MTQTAFQQSFQPTTPCFGVRSLMVDGFRSFRALNLSLSQAPVVLTAPNGSGKTNILEALSLFSPGRGLRSATCAEMQQHAHQHPWQVGIALEDNGLPISLGTQRQAEMQTERRLVKHEGEILKNQACLTDYLSVVWFTPLMGSLLSDGSQAQRQFIDRLVFSFEPIHAKKRTMYDKLLRERNAILKDYPPSTYKEWLDPIESKLADLSYDLTHSRHHILAQLEEKQSTTPLFPRFSCQMEGESDTLYTHIRSKEACVNALREQYLRSRPLDKIKGTTRIGPHRSKLVVTHTAKQMPARFCSTGEQKMLVLAMILAFVKIPVVSPHSVGLLLLLDDVMDHLDSQHRGVLLEDVMSLRQGRKSQVWMTGSCVHAFAPLQHQAQFLELNDLGINL